MLLKYLCLILLLFNSLVYSFQNRGCKCKNCSSGSYTQTCCDIAKGFYSNGVCHFNENYPGTGKQSDFSDCCAGGKLGYSPCFGFDCWNE